jgi:tetratricopeptide (TPR) repeat protein
MVGLARALADEEPAEARAALDAAEKQAPNHPEVWLAVAERELSADDADAAKRALDRLAELRPGSREEAAWRAAVAYKEQGIGAVAAAADRVRAIDSASGLGYRLASEQAARQYRFDDSANLAKQAVAIDAEDPLAYFALGLAQMRTGEEGQARRALETSWELDKSSAVTKNLLDLLDDIDTFEVAAHNAFIFKFAKEEAAVLKVYAFPLADEAYQTFVARYGFEPQGPILVEVFPRHDDFAVRTFGLPGLVGALGACFGRVVTMDSPNARPPGDFSWQATLWHEIAHVFSLQLSDYRVPRWLTEGISTYEEHRKQAGWGRELTLQYGRQLAEGKNFGVKRLPQAFKQPETLALAYFEASLVVEHLVTLNGDAGLRSLLVAYKEGAKDEEAFARAFGRTIDDVDGSFARFIETRYGALKRAMGDPPREVGPDDVAGLRARANEAPDNFASQIALAQALVKSGDLAAAEGPLERAAELAPAAQGDGSPRALLARIAEDRGDRARARRELRALLVHDHTNIEAARRLAALAAQDNVRADEDYALRLMADLNPFEADTHLRLGRRLLASGDATAALVEFQATLALGAANMAEAHADVAEALLKLGRNAEARRAALASLREAPSYARAQDLLLAASGQYAP